MMKINAIKRICIVAAILFLSSTPVNAAEVVLTSGRHINGFIVKETDAYVVIKSRLECVYPKKRIYSIIRDDGTKEICTKINEKKPDEEKEAVDLLSKDVDGEDLGLPTYILKEMERSEREIVLTEGKKGFHKIAGVKYEVERFLDEHAKLLETAYATGEEKDVRAELVKAIEYFESVINEVEGFRMDESMVDVTQAMGMYYKKLLKLQLIVLNSLSSESSDLTQKIDSAVADIGFWEEKFLGEFNKLE